MKRIYPSLLVGFLLMTGCGGRPDQVSPCSDGEVDVPASGSCQAGCYPLCSSLLDGAQPDAGLCVGRISSSGVYAVVLVPLFSDGGYPPSDCQLGQ